MKKMQLCVLALALLLCLVFLAQVWATRHFQSLPPEAAR